MSDGQDDAQKTEEPTPKKLEEAKKKGQVPLSREVNNWVMLLAGTILVAFLAPTMMVRLSNYLKSFVEFPHSIASQAGGVGIVLNEMVLNVFLIMSLPLMFLVLAAILGPFVQIGPVFSPQALKPDFSKVSPLQGFKRLFSVRSLVEFAKGILKIGTVGVVGVLLIAPFYGTADHLIDTPLPMVMHELQALVLRLMLGVLVIVAIMAVIDLAFQRQQHTQKMRMTKQEVKDEFKQAEGDPHIKARLRQLRQERARRRMMAAVPSADVVITNPTHYSIALKYDPDSMDAPLCVAKGIDVVAMRIREVAKAHDIVLYESPPLARTLYDIVGIDETIPPEQYKAVAEIISYVFRLKGKIK